MSIVGSKDFGVRWDLSFWRVIINKGSLSPNNHSLWIMIINREWLSPDTHSLQRVIIAADRLVRIWLSWLESILNMVRVLYINGIW